MSMFVRFFSMVKFSHTIFAMPFALIGFFLAIRITETSSYTILLIQIVLCMIFSRNAAMGFNRYKDRDIDALNPRTANREIPVGVISPLTALIFVILNSILFIAVCFTINKLCFYLSFLALVVILGYSYTKRFTWLSHFVLGLSLAIAPIGAYISVTGAFAAAPIILSMIVLLWAGSFDIIYSMSDEEFDRSENLHSIPERFGKKIALAISSIGHILVLPMLVWFYFSADMGISYIIGATLFSMLLLYQHKIVSSTDLTRVDTAFFTVNGIGSVLFALFAIIDLYLP